jgi:predicted AlkP superfamily phosphohydrolase/phosphomutase
MSNETRARRPGSPVLFLGIDGLSFDFLDAPLVRDAAPNLSALLGRSTVGALRSTTPPYTGPAWTTITTGVDPGRHGVFGFTDASGRPLSDATVSAERIWDYVGRAGGRSIVVNVPITFPARPIEGCIVSGMPVPPGTDFTHPVDLAACLEDHGYVVDVAVQEGRHQEGAATLERLARMTQARGRAVTHLARSEDWDLFAVVFVLPDRLGHPWWKQLVPGDRLYDTAAAERVRRHAHACVVALDNAIGDLLAELPPGATVLLCSDHGFGPLDADLFFDVVMAHESLITGDVGGRLRDLLADVGRSRLARLVPASLHRRVRTRVAFGAGVDRKAWTAPGYESGVRLADPGDLETRARVIELLREYRAPDGRRPVASAVPRAELYKGARVAEAPDVVCMMTDESITLHDGLHARTPWVSRAATTWGTHASEGVVAISGAPAPALEGAQAADVAATVLALLGIGVEGLDGRSLVGLDAHVELVGAPRDAGRADGLGAGYSPEQEAAVLEHLRGLGYVD